MRGEIILQCPYCAEKDAEIDRLKEELELERHISGSADAHIGELRKLITELCDALEKMERNWPNESKGDYDPLLLRAREAIK